MKILENHFDGKTTYILGDYINNGCQTFHIDEAQEVFEKYIIPLEMQKEVLEAFAENNSLGEEDWDRLIKSNRIKIRILIAYNKKGLDVLINDTSQEVRKAVAEQGFGLDKLVNDKEWEVRVAVAKQGFGLDKLINDESIWVKVTTDTKLKEMEKTKRIGK